MSGKFLRIYRSACGFFIAVIMNEVKVADSRLVFWSLATPSAKFQLFEVCWLKSQREMRKCL